MSYGFYKVMHLTGILITFLSIGAYLGAALGGLPKNFAGKKLAGLSHGLGLILALAGGFGLMTKLGLFASWPGWIYGKLLIWLLLGASIALISRKPHLSKHIWWGIAALGCLAALLAQFKP